MLVEIIRGWTPGTANFNDLPICAVLCSDPPLTESHGKLNAGPTKVRGAVWLTLAGGSGRISLWEIQF